MSSSPGHLSPRSLPAPPLQHLCDLVVTVGPPITVGEGLCGVRRLVPITGGQVSGPGMRGRVLPVGADFQSVADGTTAQLDARYVLALDDGALIYVHNQALRHASAPITAALARGEAVPADAVYFRGQPRFETGAAPWSWLSTRQFIAAGERTPDAVYLSIWQVL